MMKRVLFLCTGNSCPVFPGDAAVIHRSFDNPPSLARDEREEEAAMTHYRRVRDEIRDFVRGLRDSGEGGPA